MQRIQRSYWREYGVIHSADDTKYPVNTQSVQWYVSQSIVGPLSATQLLLIFLWRVHHPLSASLPLFHCLQEHISYFEAEVF